MYVISPADEVVCRSYERVIYVRPRALSSCSTLTTRSRQQSFVDPTTTATTTTTNNNNPNNTLTSASTTVERHQGSSPSASSKSKIKKNNFLSVPSLYSDLLASKEHQTPLPPPSTSSRTSTPIAFQEKRSVSPLEAKKSSIFRKRGKTSMHTTMASNPKVVADSASHALKDLTHPAHNDYLRAHNTATLKLVRTVSDFTQQLGLLYEHHAGGLQSLVTEFRKKNNDLRKERPACPSSLFHALEAMVQEVEMDSQAQGDIASIMARQLSRSVLDRSFYRKVQARKVFTHREGYETIIAKTEEKLLKCRQEYKNAYLCYLTSPTTDTLSAYFNTHNAYIQQLHATNGMMNEYSRETLPSILQELEEIYADLCTTVTDVILQSAETFSSRAAEQSKRYDNLIAQCKAVSSTADLHQLARAAPAPSGRPPTIRRPFVPPQPPPPIEGDAGTGVELSQPPPPPLKDELVIDRLSVVQVRPSFEALQQESAELQLQIRQLQDSLETLLRLQQRSIEAALHNKANELQEEISMKRFNLRVAQMHLSAINAQKELFANKLESESASSRDRKMSAASTASMKNKWLKAFKSLKPPPPPTGSDTTNPAEKKNGSAATRELLKGDPDAHNFQEYTYKKITPCDVCSQVLRGHTRQGLRCRICKMNVHVDCEEKATKCQTKARLLRRQKSTSEIESRLPEPSAEDEKHHSEFDAVVALKSPPTTFNGTHHSGLSTSALQRPPPSHQTNSHPIERKQGTAVGEAPSSMRRRLFAGVKSFTGFGRSQRQGSPGHRSISLPEKRNSQDASGTRPFGQPLCLGPHSTTASAAGAECSSYAADLPPLPPLSLHSKSISSLRKVGSTRSKK